MNVYISLAHRSRVATREEPIRSSKPKPLRGSVQFRRSAPMRNVIALCCLSLTGCVSAPFSVSPAPNQPVATLTLGARTGYPISQGYDGIWSVDGQDIPKGPVQSIFVAPGKRAIGYICPGWLSMDGPPTLSHVFEADRRYEINCENDPRIDPVLDNA